MGLEECNVVQHHTVIYPHKMGNIVKAIAFNRPDILVTNAKLHVIIISIAVTR